MHGFTQVSVFSWNDDYTLCNIINKQNQIVLSFSEIQLEQNWQNIITAIA